jgi:nitroreductase
LDTYQAIISKRDRREYDSRPLPDDVVHRILQAGRMAGSSGNSQPIRYVAFRDRANIQALQGFGRGTRHLAYAPFYVLAFVQDPARQFDIGRALQNMMLAAWDQGVFSCPASLQDAEGVARQLGVEEGWKPVQGIAFGYPSPTAPTPESRGARLPMDELVHWEKW